ncbi:MAG: CvpA family protein [Burkholderiales bacterium]
MEFFAVFTWIDWVVVTVVSASITLSVVRGLVKEVASLAVWVVAVVGASRLAHYPAELLPPWLSAPLQQTVGFLIVLVLILIIGKLITMALKELVSAAGVGTLDRILGTGFGLARGGLIVIVLSVLAAMTSLPTQPAWKTAKTRSFLELGIRTAAPWLPASVGDRLQLPSSSRQNQGVLTCVV